MNGYQQYFKQRQDLAKKKRKKAKLMSSIWLGTVATVLAGGGVWLLCGGDEQALKLLSKVEVQLVGEASAANKDSVADDNGAKGEANSADDKNSNEAKNSADDATKVSDKKSVPKTFSAEEIALFTKLDERKKQLDAREQSLNKLEEELQRQKAELEKRLAELQDVRGKIAAKLEDKVKIDQQKVESLVSVYQNMKPAAAAKVMESVDEDLAVEVLSKMKNKAAAEILNLMDADKAKHLTERFAGYRVPASERSSAAVSKQ